MSVGMNIALLSRNALTIEAMVKAMPRFALKIYDDKHALARNIGCCEVLVVQNKGFPAAVIDASVLNAAPVLKLIQHCGVSSDGTDVVTARSRGIRVATTSGTNSQSVAEIGMHLLFSAAKKAREAQAIVRRGGLADLSCTELAGKTMCLVGFGPIGKAIARMARAIPMRVLAVRRRANRAETLSAGADEAYSMAELTQALRLADFVILALPFVPETIGFFGVEAFAAMKPGACLINISRGPHVDRAALEKALMDGRLSHYAADVFWREPAEPDDPLLQNERVIITPHIGADTAEANQRMAEAVRANVERFVGGLPLENLVA